MAIDKSTATVENLLAGKSADTIFLFHHFLEEYGKLGSITLHPAKTMLGISNGQKRIAWITQVGKNFIHIVFPFKKAYPDNLCFQKIAQVPGEEQFNHHFRLFYKEDVNEEVIRFMTLAYQDQSDS